MTLVELRQLLVATLVRAHGDSRAKWRRAVGEIRIYPRDTHAHCNWEVWASGTVTEIAAVEQAVDMVRADHPWVGQR